MKFQLCGHNFWATGSFDKEFALLLRAFKDRNLVSLARPLAELLDEAVALAPRANSFLLPPKNPANFRRRGFHPIELVAARSSLLAKLRRVRAMATRDLAEQRRLGQADRQANLAGSLAVPPGSGTLLVIDDVVTTGATMIELVRAASQAGYEVVGGCAIAASSGFSVLQGGEKGVVWS